MGLLNINSSDIMVCWTKVIYRLNFNQEVLYGYLSIFYS